MSSKQTASTRSLVESYWMSRSDLSLGAVRREVSTLENLIGNALLAEDAPAARLYSRMLAGMAFAVLGR